MEAAAIVEQLWIARGSPRSSAQLDTGGEVWAPLARAIEPGGGGGGDAITTAPRGASAAAAAAMAEARRWRRATRAPPPPTAAEPQAGVDGVASRGGGGGAQRAVAHAHSQLGSARDARVADAAAILHG